MRLTTMVPVAFALATTAAGLASDRPSPPSLSRRERAPRALVLDGLASNEGYEAYDQGLDGDVNDDNDDNDDNNDEEDEEDEDYEDYEDDYHDSDEQADGTPRLVKRGKRYCSDGSSKQTRGYQGGLQCFYGWPDKLFEPPLNPPEPFVPGQPTYDCYFHLCNWCSCRPFKLVPWPDDMNRTSKLHRYRKNCSIKAYNNCARQRCEKNGTCVDI